MNKIFCPLLVGSDSSKQPYKYSNKELDSDIGLNIYDSYARLYDPQVPRFLSMDPLAEKYYSWSPYAYVMNNPMRYIDPDGRQASAVVRVVRTVVKGTKNREKISFYFNSYFREGKTLKEINKEWQLIRGEEVLNSLIERANLKNESNENSDDRTKDSPLRRDERTKEPKVDPEAKGAEHTQLGTKKGRKGEYKQGREFDKEGNPVKDIDHTDHGRPLDHTNPHQHKYKENKTRGTRTRDKEEPL